MINFNVRNENQIAFINLTTLEDISKFFNDIQIIKCINPPDLIMHLTANHYRHTYDNVKYYLHIMNIDNKSGIVTICYDPLI